MKNKSFAPAFLSYAIIILSGCSAVGAKSASISAIYGMTTLLSLLLWIGYCFYVPQRNRWFLLLSSSILVVNLGYYCLSVSQGLSQALWANRLSYLGSIFLPLSMLMILLQVTNIRYTRWLPLSLFIICLLVLFVAASPGYLTIYYKEVSFQVVNGVSTLHKVYGSWHSLYLFYLVIYFIVMVTVVLYSTAKKRISAFSHTVILLIAVFVNLGIWFIEQIVHIDFEVLSVSYIISELFLLGVHMMTVEHSSLTATQNPSPVTLTEHPPIQNTYTGSNETSTISTIPQETVDQFLEGRKRLTPTERAIYDYYIAGNSTKEIMKMLTIKENTLKFHNKNIYSKLGISSRKQLMAIHKYIQESSNTTVKQ